MAKQARRPHSPFQFSFAFSFFCILFIASSIRRTSTEIDKTGKMSVSLPPGWIMQVDPTSGRPFFVDTTANPPVSHWQLPQQHLAPQQYQLPQQQLPQQYQQGQPVQYQQGQPVQYQQGQPVQMMAVPMQPGMQQGNSVTPMLQQAVGMLQKASGLLATASATQTAQLGVNMMRRGNRGGLGRMMVNASQKNQADQAGQLVNQATQILRQAQGMDPTLAAIQPPDVKSIGGIVTQGLFDSPGFDAIRTAKLASSKRDVDRCISEVNQVLNIRR